MDINVFQSINEVVLEGLPERGLELDHDLTITPDRPGVMHFIDSPFNVINQTIRMVIGEIERDVFGKAGAFALVLQGSEEDITDEEARLFLLRVIGLTDLFLTCLWLIRDNSGNGGQGVVAIGDPRIGTVRSIWAQRPGTTNFTAFCDKRSTTYTRPEIDEGVRYFRQLLDFVLPRLQWRLDEPRPTGLIYASRIFRTLYFTEAARGMADVAVRAMYYSMAFEALLSAEAGRYSHNVPKRASQMIGTTRRERQQPYEDIYALYGYRSDVVHGSSFEPEKEAELRASTQRCDGHLRTVLRRVLNDPDLLTLFREGSNRAISQHFNDEPPDELPQRARPLFTPDPPGDNVV